MPLKAIRSRIRSSKALQGNFSVPERLPENFCGYERLVPHKAIQSLIRSLKALQGIFPALE
jgi:hypothetical protein